MSDPTKRRASRRKDHIAKDLRTPKYRERSVPAKRVEDVEAKRFRRYHNFDEFFLMEGYNLLDKDNE